MDAIKLPPEKPMTGPRAQLRQRRMRNQDHRCPPLLQVAPSRIESHSSEKPTANPGPQKSPDR
jgi:hypothetical protein